MENHTIVGGLGTIIAEKMAEAGIAKKLVRIGLRDTFSHGASKQYLLKEHKMDALSLIKEVEMMVGQQIQYLRRRTCRERTSRRSTARQRLRRCRYSSRIFNFRSYRTRAMHEHTTAERPLLNAGCRK